MNNPDHISKSSETIFLVKILKFLDADPGSGMKKFGSGMEKIRIRDKHPGSATLVSKHDVHFHGTLGEEPGHGGGQRAQLFTYLVQN
jgi:hypothetical protein